MSVETEPFLTLWDWALPGNSPELVVYLPALGVSRIFVTTWWFFSRSISFLVCALLSKLYKCSLPFLWLYFLGTKLLSSSAAELWPFCWLAFLHRVCCSKTWSTSCSVFGAVAFVLRYCRPSLRSPICSYGEPGYRYLLIRWICVIFINTNYSSAAVLVSWSSAFLFWFLSLPGFQFLSFWLFLKYFPLFCG